MAFRALPPLVISMLASHRHRLRHFLWHAVRGAWNDPRLTPDVRAFITAKGWAPPDGRAPFASDGTLILDNFAGEDFLYMHRQMIREVNDLLAQNGEQPLDAWREIPKPASAELPVPPPWAYADPDATPQQNQAAEARLKSVKSAGYFADTLAVWERFYTHPATLRRLSLGAYGNLLEMTIHNNLHMRWASEPVGYMPSPNLEDTAAIDARWDQPDYDYMGDTYSSHVNAAFWYLHGWIDQCVDRWQAANGVDEVAWRGTWTGKLEEPWQPGAALVITPKTRAAALETVGLAAGDHHHHDDGDVAEMEEIVKRLGGCRVVRNLYDLLFEP